MKNKTEIAVSKLLEGYNCAQAVLYAFCEEVNMQEDKALKMACGFGAGMARAQEVCGAVTGGIIVIGARHGRGAKEDRAVTEETYREVNLLMDKFSTRHGAYLCRELLNGCDLSREEGRSYFKEHDFIRNICAPCVRSVVEILEDIL